MTPPDEHSLARELAARYSVLAGVEAVALGGSRSAGSADSSSDVDLYVYAEAIVPVELRREVAEASGAERLELDNRFFEPGDEWLDPSGAHVDVMFRTTTWIEARMERVLERCEASVGYSTCFWFNVRHSVSLFDRYGWLANLQAEAERPFPDRLRRAIVEKNWPLLADSLSSYRQQLAKAVARRDTVSVSHRVAAWLASYFDVLFALNRELHPGEKRLVAHAEGRCPLRPARLAEDVQALVVAVGVDPAALLAALDRLAAGLEALLLAEDLP